MRLLRTVAICLFLIAPGLEAQNQERRHDLDRSMVLYYGGSFEAAFSALLDSTRTMTDPESLAEVAAALTEIGESEYRKKNYKNAYQAFRNAVRIRPTISTASQTATDLYLKMRSEMDVNNLENAEQATAPGLREPTEGSQAVETLIQELKNQRAALYVMQTRLSQLDLDLDELKKQVAHQTALIDQFIRTSQDSDHRVFQFGQENAKLLEENLKLVDALATQSLDKTTVIQIREALEKGQRDQRLSVLIGGSVVVVLLLVLLGLVLASVLGRHRGTPGTEPTRESLRWPNQPTLRGLPGPEVPSPLAPLLLPISSPFETRKLLDIPEALKGVLMNRDRSGVCARLAFHTARVLNLSVAEATTIANGALIRDVGYLMMPLEELHASLIKGQLSQVDRSLIQRHAELGASYFFPDVLPEVLEDIVRHHHERLDGSGYPDRLRGNDLSMAARIVGVIDTFVALVSERPYRPRLPPAQALERLFVESPEKYDREVVLALRDVLQQLRSRSPAGEPHDA